MAPAIRRDAASSAARLQVMAAAALFSTGGAAIKACSLTGPQVACLRSGIAALAVLIALPESRRGWTRGSVAVGAAYAATMVLFVWSNKLTTAASSIFLQSTSPLFILLLGPWILRERARPRDVAFTAALGAAMLMLFFGSEAPQATAPDPLRGNFIALLSGACYAVTVVGLRWLARHDAGPLPRSRGEERAAADLVAQPDAVALPGNTSQGSPAATVLAGNALAFATCLPAALPVTGATTTDWAVLVYLGVFQIGLAYTLLTRAMRGVTALETSLLLLVEPMLNPLWAWAVQGETPGAWTLAGGAIIMSATAARTLVEARAGRE